MARQVINITHSANRYDILSQTPNNYDKNNYFLKELQDKVDAEWEYRPNRVDIEYENNWKLHSGETGDEKYQLPTYAPIEVVMQSVKSEKGNDISDDYRKIVFKDILERRFKIGSRFRFGAFIGADSSSISDEDKNVWLSTNTDSVKMTSSMIIERCNGTLGSLYVDSQGVSQYHYEPVIQKKDLSSVNFIYNDMVVSPQAQLEITAQHNDYTRDYFINQRFIVGYDRVYRIKAINKFYSNSTFDSQNVGIIKIYLELTEASPYDDFTHRIAYQNDATVVMHKEDDAEETYTIKFTTPTTIPSNISTQPVIFTPIVLKADGTQDTSKTVHLSCSLANLPSTISLDKYVVIEETVDENNSQIFTITRQRIYNGGKLTLQWSIVGIGNIVSFDVGLR